MKDRSKLDEIKRKVNLVQVIDKFGGAELHGDGDKRDGWHKAHESKSKRSLHVDNAAGVWHCKSCGEGGDLFDWVGHVRFNSTWNRKSVTMFAEAMREVADFAGVEIPEYDAEEAAERRNVEDIWGLASDFYHEQLTAEHRDYFHKRGYTDETIDKYKLGFAPSGGRALLASLISRHKIDGDELVKSGLFLKRDTGSIEDHFQGRLMFPYWRNGRPSYFIGRITDQSPKWEHDRGMKYKKLLVHNESHPYVSEQVDNRYFYGEDSVMPGGDLLITEGVADCLSALQAGFACVSPVTVRFAKKDHAKILELAERAGTVYICNDNEESNAGSDGTLATAKMLWENGKVAKLVTLPRPSGVDKIDLNDFLSTHGAEAFKKLLPTAKSLLDLKVDEYAAAPTDEAKIAIQRTVLDLVAYVNDKFQLESWKRKLPKLIGLSATAFTDMLKDARRALVDTQVKESPAVSSDVIAKVLADEGYTFALNELSDTIEVTGRLISAGVAAEIRTRMRDRGYRYMEEIEDVYTTIAYKNRYHPVKQFFESLQWDGQNHIRTLGRYIEDDHPPIVYPEYPNRPMPVFDLFLGRWMVGAVAKLYEAGKVKAQNPVLVLDGPQNLGKSSFARWVGSPLPDLMIESPIRPDDKDHQRYLASMWIWEVAEIGATTRKADREALKDFITRHEVTFRKPYDRHPISKPALASFIGTINNENGFLTDPTGNRRFLTVRLKSIDWRYLDVVDINQLWAQAFALYKQGESWQLNATEMAIRNERNAEYMVEDPFEGWILKYYDVEEDRDSWLTTTTDITETLQANGVKGETKGIQMAVAASLKRMGLRQHANARPRAWVGIQRKDNKQVRQP